VVVRSMGHGVHSETSETRGRARREKQMTEDRK
jgi:hypothetical protein